MKAERQRWTHELNAYHWFVFLVASAAWFFDCLDQRLFSLARNPALSALAPSGDVQSLGKSVTALFLLGWGCGGLTFGPLGDRYGRSKMLTFAVLIYSACTGFTFFSQSYWDFALFRFLTGVGVGGVFGLAVALIAESLPDSARAGALGMLQILSTIGNIAAAMFKMLFDYAERNDIIAPSTGWRWMFLVGALPAFLVVLTMRYLREPESWLRLKAEGRLPKGSILAPYRELVSEKRWRKNLIVGALIASTGVIGLWAIGEYLTDLQKFVFYEYYKQAGLPEKEIGGAVEHARTWAYILNMLGAGVGMWLFTKAAIAFGRRPAFAMGFTASLVTTLYVYWKINSPWDAYWMMTLVGIAQLSVFAGFAIYLPEIFPSRVRSTGTSFCYNLGRFAAAGGSLFSAALATQVFGAYGSPLKERYAAMAMCSIFLIGLCTLPFAPETKDQPLPE